MIATAALVLVSIAAILWAAGLSTAAIVGGLLAVALAVLAVSR